MIPMTNSLIGIVEDVQDPLNLGRVRCRYLRIHTDNKSLLPTEQLPWSNVLGSIYSASISGVGTSPVGMVPGTMVWAFPLDDGYQEFMVIGTIAGNRSVHINNNYGFNDPNGEYPRAGVQGDINKRSGGNGDTGLVIDDSISSVIPGSNDPTIPDKTLDPSAFKDAPWMPIAISQIGINETDNPDTIKQYHSIGGGLAREPSVAWCASFVGWCLDKVNITGSRSASSRSYLSYGNSVGKTSVPYGSIAVFGVPNSGSGHAAFVVSDKGDALVCVGGNQSDKSLRSGGIVSQTTIPKNGKSLVLLDCVYPTNLNQKD